MCGASPAARAGELRSLHDSVSARLDGCRFQQPRSARRRTTGHLPSKRRRRGRDAGAGDGTTSAAEEEGMPGKRHSRRVRRRRELAAGNPAAEGFSVAGDGARRLRTHLCHAKEVLHGEVGASSCPSAPREEEGVHGLFSSGWKMEQLFMMPATSFQDSLLSIVRMVMLSCPEDKTTSLNHLHSQVMRGVCYENAMLWRVGSPHSEIVGPVTYMWCPFLRDSAKMETEDAGLSNSQTRFLQGKNNSLRRQLWIWIHPAVLDEGLGALRITCEKQILLLKQFHRARISNSWSQTKLQMPIKHHLRELWDSTLKSNPPVDKEILCMERHHRCIKFFCLDFVNDGQITQEKDSVSRSFPVIFLKHAKGDLLSLGWSVILPLSWVKTFWLFLVSHGAHAIGLRERQWITSKFKMPCFPYDYLDNKAYSLLLTEEAAGFNKATNCRCASMRAPRVPVPPLWHCILSSFRKRDGIVSTMEVDDLKLVSTVLPESLPVNSNPCEASSSATIVPTSFQLLVPRTIQMLRQVLIRAFKEGSFKEGAVVCAPLPSDLSAWKTRSVSHGQQRKKNVQKNGNSGSISRMEVLNSLGWMLAPARSSCQMIILHGRADRLSLRVLSREVVGKMLLQLCVLRSKASRSIEAAAMDTSKNAAPRHMCPCKECKISSVPTSACNNCPRSARRP